MTNIELYLFGVAIIAPLIAKIYLEITFSKYKKMSISRDLDGKTVAEMILKHHQIENVSVIKVDGKLTDHYDPIRKKLALSDEVYSKKNIVAVAVAAHEVGHAIQDAKKYPFLVLRTASFPIVSFASKLAPFLIIIGLFSTYIPQLLLYGIICMSAGVFFSLITLPVEIDASRRALQTINSMGILSSSEMPAAKKLLSAAAFTYIAAAITAVAEIVRLLLIYNQRR